MENFNNDTFESLQEQKPPFQILRKIKKTEQKQTMRKMSINTEITSDSVDKKRQNVQKRRKTCDQSDMYNNVDMKNLQLHQVIQLQQSFIDQEIPQQNQIQQKSATKVTALFRQLNITTEDNKNQNQTQIQQQLLQSQFQLYKKIQQQQQMYLLQQQMYKNIHYTSNLKVVDKQKLEDNKIDEQTQLLQNIYPNQKENTIEEDQQTDLIYEQESLDNLLNDNQQRTLPNPSSHEVINFLDMELIKQKN